MSSRWKVGRAAVSANSPSAFLERCIDASLENLRARPGDIWSNLLSIQGDPSITEIFDRARTEASSPFALPHDIVFPPSLYPLHVHLQPGYASLVIEDGEMLGRLRQTLSGEWEDLPVSDPSHQFARELRDAGMLTPAPAAPLLDQPGVYRLQHASLFFRSKSGTGILTDPVSEYSTLDWLRPQDVPGVHAVVISHSHEDHFSLWTLMQFPKHTTIIVPKVPRHSMLCPDMATLLRDAGFARVVEAPWNSTIRIEDVALHIYPFYGEQPWLTFDAPAADLRSHGNTFVIEMDGYRTWLLIDSGREYGHSMEDLCKAVLAELGSIDLVLSNLRSFVWHPKQIDGSGRYLFCYTTDTLNDPASWPTGQLMTFGTRGMSRFLQKLQPKNFLPYAHWWHPPQRTPHVVDGHHSETDLLADIRNASDSSLTTELLGWQVGSRLAWHDGCATILSEFF